MHHEGRLGAEHGEIAAHKTSVGILRPSALIAQVPDRVGIFDVVGLVKHDLVGATQVPQAREGGDQGGHHGGNPAVSGHYSRGQARG